MSLTQEQASSIERCNENKLLVALPGAGKTHTSISLASKIIGQNPDNSLLMVTFTNAATNELRERLSRSLDPQQMARVRISTFASIMLEQARPLLGRRKLIIGAEQESYAKRAMYSTPVKEKLLRAVGLPVSYNKKGRLIEPDDPDYKELLSELPMVFQELCREYPEEEGDGPADFAFKKYKEMLTQYGRIDLDMVTKELVIALSNREVEPYKFTHIIVDEFQDSDNLQYLWLKAHHDAGAYVTVVGDDDQSIYGWRGGLGIKNMARVIKEFQAKQYALQTCFRCAPEILQFAGKLIGANLNRIPKEMRSGANPGGKITVREYAPHELKPLLSDDKYKTLMEAQFGAEWKEQGFSMKDLKLNPRDYPESHAITAAEIAESPEGWAILARTNASLDLIEAELGKYGIDILRLGGKSIWENEVVRALLNIMYGMCYGNDPSILVSGLAWLGETEANLRKIHQEMSKHKDFSLVDTVDTNYINSVVALQHLTPLFRNWSDFNRYDELYDRLVEAVIQSLDEEWKRKAVINKLTWMMDMLAGMRGDMKQRMAAMLKASQRKKTGQETKNPDGVVLSTMSSSKGLEWEKVWIIDVEEKRSPSKITSKAFEEYLKGEQDEDFESALEEERRLLYVGMTRAERELVVSFRQGRCSPFIYHDMSYSQYVA